MMKRREYTERIIQDSLYQLLEKNPSQKITVTKLCEVADINRATFYQYYSSIEELFEKTMASFYKDIASESRAILEEHGSTYDAVRRIVVLSLTKYATVPAYYPLLNHMDRDKIHRYIYSQYVSQEDDTPYFRALMDFVMSGGEGVCSQWIAKGFVTPITEMADMIASFICKCFA